MSSADHSFDEATVKKFRACKKEGFPICLRTALTHMFGDHGQSPLDRIVMKEGFENPDPQASYDKIWDIYDKYLQSTARILGDDVAMVIGFQGLQQMKSMCCTKCPLYERELEGFQRRIGSELV